MSNFKKHLILYSPENQQVAEQLAGAFQNKGHEAMVLERTVSDISTQVGQIAPPEGSNIVFLITDNFLKSYGCMNGILQAAHKWGDSGHLNSIVTDCLLYTSPSPRDRQKSRMPSSA